MRARAVQKCVKIVFGYGVVLFLLAGCGGKSASPAGGLNDIAAEEAVVDSIAPGKIRVLPLHVDNEVGVAVLPPKPNGWRGTKKTAIGSK